MQTIGVATAILLLRVRFLSSSPSGVGDLARLRAFNAEGCDETEGREVERSRGLYGESLRILIATSPEETTTRHCWERQPRVNGLRGLWTGCVHHGGVDESNGETR